MITTVTKASYLLDTPECINAITQFNLSNLHWVFWLNTRVTVHPNVSKRTSMQGLWVLHRMYLIKLQSILGGGGGGIWIHCYMSQRISMLSHWLWHIWNTVIHTIGCHKKRPVKGSETTTLKRFLINTSVTQALFWSFVLFTSLLPFHQTHTHAVYSLFWSTSSTPLCWQISGYSMFPDIKASTLVHYKLCWTECMCTACTLDESVHLSCLHSIPELPQVRGYIQPQI